MAPSILEYPSGCGRRLLPVLIDRIAQIDPEKPYISLARTSNPQEGFKDITFGVFARAINRCSWWIEANLGRGLEFPTIFTYLEPQDLRHTILVLAAHKTGYKVS